MTKIIRICNHYLPAHWQGEDLALIPRYHPNFKPELLSFEEIEVPDDIQIPKLVNPDEIPLTTLQEICALHDYLLSWFINIEKEIPSLKPDDTVGKAMDQFVAFRSCGTTLTQYRRMFSDLINEGVIDPKATVASYLEKAGAIEKLSLNFSKLDPNIYNYNDKIYHLLKSFRTFLQDPQLQPAIKKRKTEKFYRAKRKNRPTDEEVKLLFAALKEINPLHELIARILWWFNRESVDHPDAPVVHLESVLRMKYSDIGLDPFAEERAILPDIAGGNSVSICTHHLKKTSIVAFFVPGTMYVHWSN